jgi:hypothetical protein
VLSGRQGNTAVTDEWEFGDPPAEADTGVNGQAQPSGPGGSSAPAPAPPSSPSPRRLFIIAVFSAVLGLMVTLSFGYADHNPQPHHVRIAVSAPRPVLTALSDQLAKQAPGGFSVVPVAGPDAALASVRSQSTLGAFVVPAAGRATIVTAGAQGTLAQQVITKVLTAASARLHRSVTSTDVATLNPGDHSGLGAFVFGLGLLIPSVIGSVALFLLGNRMRLWWRVLAALVFAVLVACGGTLAMDTIFGALTGNGGALIGIGFLGAASFVLFVAAVQSLVGLPGTGLAALAFIFVGNAISGGSVPVAFLPNVFRQVAPWLPNNAIVRGVRDVTYYGGSDLGHVFLVLGLWPAVSLVLLLGVDRLHLRARAKMPELNQEIYSTPGIVHLRAQLSAASHHPSQLRPGASVHPPVQSVAFTPVESVASAPPRAMAAPVESAAPSPAVNGRAPAESTAPAPADSAAPATAFNGRAAVFALHLPGSVPIEESEPIEEPEPVEESEPIEEPEPVEEPKPVGAEHHAPELPANSGFPHVPVIDVPETGAVPEPEAVPEPVAEPETLVEPEPEPAPAPEPAPEPAPASLHAEHLTLSAERVTLNVRQIVIRTADGSLTPGEIEISVDSPPAPDDAPQE